MNRRIRRLLGKEEVPGTTPRVFVRAVNASSEVQETLSLFEALEQALPECKVYLLLLVDFQPASEMVSVKGVSDSVLVYKVDKSLFADNGAAWTMQKQSEAYAVGLSRAVRWWAGDTKTDPEKIESLSDMSFAVSPFEGGDAASELFFPKEISAPPKTPDTVPSRAACAAVAHSGRSPRRDSAPGHVGVMGSISMASQATVKSYGAASVQLASANIVTRVGKSPTRNQKSGQTSLAFPSPCLRQSPLRARPAARKLAHRSLGMPLASACVP
jgi:hypothetical protein